jgi:exo-1,4-beta-D-glucosaminidase
MLPEEHLWPIDSWWNFHAGGGAFRDLHVFTEALNKRYGPAASVEDYARKSQLMSYEGERAMFEAYGRNKFTSTGVIQWMLNNAWPSVIWHLYDWYGRPGGGYFGTKKACEPLHVQYSYDDRSVAIVNSYMKPFPAMKVTAKIYALDMAEKFSKQAAVDVAENSSVRAFELPEVKGLGGTYFVSLALADAAGAAVSRNFYWLSTAPETLDWDKSTWYVTPTKTFADYTALDRLPQVEVTTSAKTAANGAGRTTTVTLTNPGKAIAFAIHLKITDGPDGQEFLPVLWEDNYFSLLPGETRQVAAKYNVRRPRGGAEEGESSRRPAPPVVQVEGWNVKPKMVP